jgi:hypothetical protein
VFLAIDYALCVALVTFWLVVAITVGEWRLAGCVLAVVWMTFAVWASRDLSRTLAAWAGRTVPPRLARRVGRPNLAATRSAHHRLGLDVVSVGGPEALYGLCGRFAYRHLPPRGLHPVISRTYHDFLPQPQVCGGAWG